MSIGELEIPIAAPRPRVSAQTRTSLGVAGAAAGLGFLGDALLRSAPWGINLALWAAALVIAIAALQRWTEADDTSVAWMPVALGAAALMAWRDSPTLKALDLAALGIILGLAMLRARGGQVRLAGLAHHAAGVAASAGDAAIGAAALLFRDVRWSELRSDGVARHGVAVVRGGAIAMPLLLLFGGLLASADARFERLLGGAFDFDFPALVGHVCFALLVAWVCGGILRTMTVGGDAPGPRVTRPEGLSLGIVETGIVLGLLDLLFLAFVVVQLPYFFGSADVVQSAGSTSFSEYARRGFFELVTVAGLVLPMLLFADWIVRKDHPTHLRVFRWLAGAQVALLFVIMASALHRMRLYQGAYGLTELRLYTTAFMLWLGAVSAWFAWTVLRGARERFAWGALTTAMEALVILHVVNPDAAIVRVNAARADAVLRFDAAYAASLSADAVPPLLAALGKVHPDARCQAAGKLHRRWGGEEADWRSWSLSRGRARSMVGRRAAQLQAMDTCPAAAPPVSVLPTPETATVTPAPSAPAPSNAGVQGGSRGVTTLTTPASEGQGGTLWAAPGSSAPGTTTSANGTSPSAADPSGQP
jgi:hypothetical protein